MEESKSIQRRLFIPIRQSSSYAFYLYIVILLCSVGGSAGCGAVEFAKQFIEDEAKVETGIMINGQRQTQGAHVYLYADEGQSGEKRSFLNMDLDRKCRTVTKEWQGRAASVKTSKDDGCVLLFEQEACQGRRLRLDSRSPCRLRLAQCHFKNMTKSLQLC